jgi:hypothetical protein
MAPGATLAPLAPLGTLGGGLGTGTGVAGDPPINRTIAETLRLGAETRKLGKFELQQHKWDEVTATLAGKLGRQPQELAMQRGGWAPRRCLFVGGGTCGHDPRPLPADRTSPGLVG